MAIRPDYRITSDDIRNFCSTTGVRPAFVCYSTAGSGAAMDNASNVVAVLTHPSGGLVAGALFNDVVNVDITRYKLNEYKNEVNINQKVHLITRGEVTTNLIHGTPTAGAPAYLSENGYVRTATSGAAATPQVGKFKTTKDEDGFATITIEIE